jgi:hypothetical protein
MMRTILSKSREILPKILKIGMGRNHGVNYNIGIMNIRKSFPANISDFPVKADFDQCNFFGDVICNFSGDFTLLSDFDHLSAVHQIINPGVTGPGRGQAVASCFQILQNFNMYYCYI